MRSRHDEGKGELGIYCMVREQWTTITQKVLV